MKAVINETDVPFVNNNNVIRRIITEGLYCKDHYTPEKWCAFRNQLFTLPKKQILYETMVKPIINLYCLVYS